MERAANPVDFLRAFGCFCIVWFHTPFYWALTANDQRTIDISKFIGISWAMPFFYSTAFYFLLLSGIKKTATSVMIRKMKKILIIQILVVIIYEIHGMLLSFSQGVSFSTIMITSANKISFSELIRMLLSGNSSPAYFLAELFLLYLPIYYLGRAIRGNTYKGFLLIVVLSLIYFLGIDSVFITREAYIYLALAVAVTLRGNEVRINISRNKVLYPLIITLLFSWRFAISENLFIVFPLLSAYYCFTQYEKTLEFNKKISRFGQNYSLFIFLCHSLMFSGIEFIIYRLDPLLEIIASHPLLVFSVINLSVFTITATLAIYLHNRFNWILRL